MHKGESQPKGGAFIEPYCVNVLASDCLFERVRVDSGALPGISNLRDALDSGEA